MNGVTEYTVATVTVYFPKGHEKCALCPLLETYSRNQCRASGEYLIDTRGRGMLCPLVMEESNEETAE
jgi:hypothetical protein